MFHSAYLPKCIIPLLLWIRCILPKAHRLLRISPTTINLTQNIRWKGEVWLPFLPKTLKTIWKRTVTKTTLNLTPRFWRQRSAILRTFGETGSDGKFRISGRIYRIFLKMLALLRFVSISDWKMQKKSLNTECTHARDFIVRFYHSIKDKAEAQGFKKFFKLNFKS